MFKGISGIKEASEFVGSQRLKIALIGKPKTGKSWCAATAPGPVFFADFDDRAISLQGKPNVYVKTYNYDSPNAVPDLEADIGRMKYAAKNGDKYPTTVVLDSASYIKKAMETALISQHPNLCRQVKLGGVTYKIPTGFDMISGTRGYLEHLIAEISSFTNIIVIFHEKDEKDTDKSTTEKTVYTGKLTVDPQYFAPVLSTFNEVWRLEVDGQKKYTLSVRPNYEFNGCTTLTKIADKEIPDISKLLEKNKV